MMRLPRALTVLLSAALLGAALMLPGLAHADRVLVLAPISTERADPALIAQLHGQLEEAVRAMGHTAVHESAALAAEHSTLPSTQNEMRALGELERATYVLATRFDLAGEQAPSEMLFRTGYLPDGRVEELVAPLDPQQQPERLNEIVAAMLRPGGLGADAVRLAQPLPAPEPPALAAPEPAVVPVPVPEPVPEPEPPSASLGPAPSAAPWLLQAGLGVRGIVAHTEQAKGGAMGAVEFRLGRLIDPVPGLEARGGLDITFGAATGFTFFVGAAYTAAPFSMPLRIGGAVETGVYQALTGNRVPSFMLRGSGLIAYPLSEGLDLELAFLELTYLSANSGALTVGASLRLGLRF